MICDKCYLSILACRKLTARVCLATDVQFLYIEEMQISEINRQRIVLVLIALSFFPVTFVVQGEMTIIYRVSKFGAYAGVITLWWAYLLGIRRFTKFFIKDITWAMKIHKWFNIVGFLVFLLHPLALLGLLNPILSPSSTFALPITTLIPEFAIGEAAYRANLLNLGVMAFYAWALIWVTSALFKGRMKFRLWKFIHLLTYPILFFGLIHLEIGFLHKLFPILDYFNYFFLGSFVLVVIWQLAGRLGILIPWYEIVKVEQVSQGAVSLRLHPLNSFPMPIRPEPGQYIYIQDKRAGESHPFSISDYDPDTKQIEITIKDLGKFSKKVQNYQVGQQLIVDGPYGVFLKEIDTNSKNVVFMAGGVGITPFMSVLRVLSRIKQDDENIWLFFGNKTYTDMMFREELDKLSAENDWLKVVHILDSQPDFEGEQGFITSELLKKYLDNLNGFEYFMCGPPIMMTNVSKDLIKAGVHDHKIHMEEFSA